MHVCIRHSGIARATTGFSLVEVVIVVTIIGIISAIAVPRISQAAQGASANALQATITNVRKAIDEYYAEHDRYPGYDPTTKAADGNRFVDQLTLFSDFAGNTSGTYGSPYLYGPYLRKPFPTNPINKLDTVFVKAAPGSAGPSAGMAGWVAVLSHGYFGIVATDVELGRVGVKLRLRNGLVVK